MACAPSEDSDQPGHPHEESFGPCLPIECLVKTLIRMGGCPGWSESSLGAQVILFVLSWGGSVVSDSLILSVWVTFHKVSLYTNNYHWCWIFSLIPDVGGTVAAEGAKYMPPENIPYKSNMSTVVRGYYKVLSVTSSEDKLKSGDERR